MVPQHVLESAPLWKYGYAKPRSLVMYIAVNPQHTCYINHLLRARSHLKSAPIVRILPLTYRGFYTVNNVAKWCGF